MDEFLNHLAVILEVENLSPGTPLKNFPLLDSLGILSTIAMLDTHYGVNIGASDIQKMDTPEDLWNHVQRIKNSEIPSISQ